MPQNWRPDKPNPSLKNQARARENHACLKNEKRAKYREKRLLKTQYREKHYTARENIPEKTPKHCYQPKSQHTHAMFRLVLAGRRFKLDRIHGQITEYGRFLRWRISQLHRIDDFDHLRVEMTKSSSGSGAKRSTSYFHEIQLVPKSQSAQQDEGEPALGLVVYGYQNEELAKANKLAHEISEYLGISFTPAT